MPARNGFRRRLSILPVAALATVALTTATAAAQAPGLPRTFDVTRIDSPSPVGGGAFGWGIYSADLTGDGKQDLLVAQGQADTGSRSSTIEAPQAKIFIFNGVTGGVVDTIGPPESNPLEPQLQPAPPAAPVPPVYRAPELGFVYVETMPDLGSCVGGDGPDADKICDRPTIGAGDDIPEILVGSRNLRVNETNGATPPVFDDPNISTDAPSDPLIGRGYVIDGATRAVLKRIDMPAADRTAVRIRSGRSSGPAFGRTMASPQGLPPCAGARGENNDAGVGPCPTDPRYPRAVRIGDLNGGGQPDIVITARGFPETGNLNASPDGTLPAVAGSAATGSQCRNNARTQVNPSAVTPTNPQVTAATCLAGKAWVYAGEDIAGTDPRAILATTMQRPGATPADPTVGTTVTNPDAQTGGGEFGGNLWRVGDITGGRSNAGDGVPDYIIPARSHDVPLKNPDPDAGLNVGSAYLVNGATGAVARTIVSPEPQIRSQFSGNFNAGRAVGDLGASGTPDILLPAALQNVRFADEGKAWVLNGDTNAGGGGEQSFNFGMLTDPEPYVGGNFGGGLTGVGDLVGGPGAPANEVLIGGFRFDNFTEASQNTVPDVNFMNATLDKNLMTIPHPEGGRGDGFGVGITPMGDLNSDGFLDFSVSAYFADFPLGGQGRAWIFKSNNSPPPPPPAQAAAVATGPAAPGAEDGPALKAGRCTNRTMGTDATETLQGTLAGDEIFGFGGNDRVMGFQGEDCIDGGTGNDGLSGGDDDDRQIGGHGKDRLTGGDGRDSLFGGTSSDRLDGGNDNDMLAGGAASDDLIGRSGDDRMFGEAGGDRIVGGGGRNQIDGGAGDDSIEARNGERDRIICGTGRDRVRADRYDRINGCETVSYGGKITKRGVLPPRAAVTAARASSQGQSR